MDTPGGVVALFRVGVWQALRRAAGCGGVIIPCVCVGRSGGRVGAVATCRRTTVCAPLRVPPGVLACRRGIKNARHMPRWKVMDETAVAIAAFAAASVQSGVRARCLRSSAPVSTSSPRASGSTPDRIAAAPPRPARG